MPDIRELTDSLVKNATCPDGKSEHFIRDSKQDRLALRVRATGSRSLGVVVTRPGREGSHFVTIKGKPTVAQARKEARVIVGRWSQGIDVIAERRKAKAAAKAAADDRAM